MVWHVGLMAWRQGQNWLAGRQAGWQAGRLAGFCVAVLPCRAMPHSCRAWADRYVPLGPRASFLTDWIRIASPSPSQLQPYRLWDSGPLSLLLGVGMSLPLILNWLASSLYASEWAKLGWGWSWGRGGAGHAGSSKAGHSTHRQASVLANGAATAGAVLVKARVVPQQCCCCTKTALRSLPACSPSSPCPPAPDPPPSGWRERLVVALRLYVVAFINLVSIRSYQVRGRACGCAGGYGFGGRACGCASSDQPTNNLTKCLLPRQGPQPQAQAAVSLLWLGTFVRTPGSPFVWVLCRHTCPRSACSSGSPSGC